MFSTGLSSGLQGGSVSKVMFAGTTSSFELCQPAPSRTRSAGAPGETALAISARCRVIVSVLA